MVKEGIVIGHKISQKGIEVDLAKVEIIAKLLPPTHVKGIKTLLWHVACYRRFIKVFSKIVKHLSNLLLKSSKFTLDDGCLSGKVSGISYMEESYEGIMNINT